MSKLTSSAYVRVRTDTYRCGHIASAPEQTQLPALCGYPLGSTAMHFSQLAKSELSTKNFNYTTTLFNYTAEKQYSEQKAIIINCLWVKL